MSSIQRILALTNRNLKEILRDPLSLIFLYGVPFIMLILFYFLFHSATSQFEMRYLAPGMVVFGQAFITLFIGTLIASDKASSFIIRIYTTEIRSYEFITSYALAIAPIALSQSLGVLVIAGLIDSSFFTWSILLATLASLVTALLFIAFGILFGSLFNEKSVGGIASIVIMMQSILSGMWFPIEGLSEGFVKALDILPFKNSSLIIQQSIDLNSTTTPILIVLGYAIVLFTMSIVVYKKRMKQ
ncbi:MAG: ABC transporter permease [Bacilli bacterium]|jgi:ABC-2 type transport system permease protein|nr:ABC transporter permease [Bacilli bacterium]